MTYAKASGSELEGGEHSSDFEGPVHGFCPHKLIALLFVVLNSSWAILATCHLGGSHGNRRIGQDKPALQWNWLDHATARSHSSPRSPSYLRLLADIESEAEQAERVRETLTACMLDVTQAAAYLGAAVVFLDNATSTCLNPMLPGGCAVSVSELFTCLVWIASYLSLAASSCASTIHTTADCVADISFVINGLTKVANHSSVLAEGGCDDADPHTTVSRRLFLSSTLDLVASRNSIQMERDAVLTQCTFDTLQALSYVVLGSSQLKSAAHDCSDPTACSTNVLHIIGSFAWITQFVSMLVSDCPSVDDGLAWCTGEMTDMLQAVSSLSASVASATVDCKGQGVGEPMQGAQLVSSEER